MHAGQKLIDHLHGAARARLLAQAPDLAGNRVKHRPRTLERVGRSAGHDHHAAGARRRRAAGDRGIQHQHPVLAQLARQRARVLGRHGDTAQHHRALPQTRHGAVRPEQHGLHLRVVDDEQCEQIHAVRQLGRRADHPCPGLAQLVARGCADVAAGQRKPFRREVERGAHAHRAEADKTHLHAPASPSAGTGASAVPRRASNPQGAGGATRPPRCSASFRCRSICGSMRAAKARTSGSVPCAASSRSSASIAVWSVAWPSR